MNGFFNGIGRTYIRLVALCFVIWLFGCLAYVVMFWEHVSIEVLPSVGQCFEAQKPIKVGKHRLANDVKTEKYMEEHGLDYYLPVSRNDSYPISSIVNQGSVLRVEHFIRNFSKYSGESFIVKIKVLSCQNCTVTHFYFDVLPNCRRFDWKRCLDPLSKSVRSIKCP
jgi:hypothetical protein